MNKENEVLCIDRRYFFCKCGKSLYRLDMEADVSDSISKRGIAEILVNGLLDGLPITDIERKLENFGHKGFISIHSVGKRKSVEQLNH